MCRTPASLGVDQTRRTRRVGLGAKGHGRHRNSSPPRQHGPHRSVGRAGRAWVAGGPPPDPRWRDPGPEGAAGKGHLDLEPAWPSRGCPCPSARRSPQVPAGSSPSRRRPRTSGLPLPCPGPLASGPRGLLCPPRTGQARAGRPGSLPGAWPSAPRPRPLLPPPPPRQLPRARPATPGARKARAALRGAYLSGGGGRLSGCYRGGCSERNEASGPRAGLRGQRRRGPAPTLRARTGELRP